MNAFQIVLLAASLTTVLGPVVAVVGTIVKHFLNPEEITKKGQKFTVIIEGSSERIEARSLQDLEQALHERTQQ